VPPYPTPYVSSARGVRQFGFLGAFARLSATTTTPDSLQRLRCCDDDMVDPTSLSNATGYLFLSLLFIYAFFFLSLLQSSFLYACLEYVLFIIINYIYVIMFKPSVFWIKIMCKLSSFLTASKIQANRSASLLAAVCFIRQARTAHAASFVPVVLAHSQTSSLALSRRQGSWRYLTGQLPFAVLNYKGGGELQGARCRGTTRACHVDPPPLTSPSSVVAGRGSLGRPL
jgi:hypothetical protein